MSDMDSIAAQLELIRFAHGLPIPDTINDRRDDTNAFSSDELRLNVGYRYASAGYELSEYKSAGIWIYENTILFWLNGEVVTPEQIKEALMNRNKK